MAKRPAEPDTGMIVDTSLGEALGERYLSYALSTIMSRSLPDARDGLKPVHRRLLYAMRELRLASSSPPRKCARVVGDVIGKFHPHGDTAVYDAMVRLAQDFAVRYPLVEGQGNFGNIDGDNAAAMRYTEARLTEVAELLLQGIDEDTVDFRPTYDGEQNEPVVLPAAFPNLLANGASGIAVGMATNIPPHNVAELCDALLALVKRPDATAGELMRHVRGPDFPTGGVLVEPAETIAAAYAVGRGSLRVRARWESEDLGRGTYQVVVTELPYQVPKARLIERIATLLEERKLPLLEDVRDESTEDVRLVLVPKSRNVDPAVLMESLFRLTDLENRFALNLNVLDGEGVPRVMDLAALLRTYLDHRHEVLMRRTAYRLARIDARLEILDGLLIAYLNLDEVIRVVREEDDPHASLMAAFGLSDVQATAILNMRLRSLRKLEEMEIRREHGGLSAEREDLLTLQGDAALQWSTIADEVKALRKRFGPATALGRRRTDIGGPPPVLDVSQDVGVEREPVTVLLSEKGWVRAIRGHVQDVSEQRYKEGDSARYVLRTETTEKLLLLADNGRMFTLPVDRIPRGRGTGEPIRLLVDLGNDQDIILATVHRPEGRLLLASADGRGFIVPESAVVAQTRAGRQVLNLPEGGRAVAGIPAEGDTVAVVGQNRKLLVFPLSEVPEMVRGRGVVLQKYRDGGLSDIKVFRAAEGLSWPSGSRTRTETDLRPWTGRRGQTGRLPPPGFPRSNRFG